MIFSKGPEICANNVSIFFLCLCFYSEPLQVTFSSGAFVRADVSDWGMSLTLRAPLSDRGHTEGLCGTYDGRSDNDFHSAGGAGLGDLHAFITAWRSVTGTGIKDLSRESNP